MQYMTTAVLSSLSVSTNGTESRVLKIANINLRLTLLIGIILISFIIIG